MKRFIELSMQQFLINVFLKRDSGLELAIELHFDFHPLPCTMNWQEKAGSVQFIHIKDCHSGERLIDLSFNEYAQLRQACWAFLEGRSL